MSGKITKKLDKKIDKLTLQWKVVFSKEAINEEVDKQVLKLQPKVNIEGFRSGKAPKEVIEKKYGEELHYRAVNSLIRESINEILKDEKYKIALQPEISFTDGVKKDEDITIHIKFVIKPEVPDVKYEKIELDTYELELSEKDKEEELNNFRSKMAKPKLDETDKKVENEDIVDIDFVGKKAEDNVEFPGGSAKGYKLEIGSHAFIEGFEEQLIGHKKGETFDIKVKFPAKYHSNELAGKDAIFTITLNEIYIKELPELNDEFAKSLGFENIEKVKELLFNNLKNVYESNSKQFLRDKIFNTMIEKNKIDLPESVIEKELNDRMEHEKEIHKDEKGWNEKTTKNKIEEGIRKSYASFYFTDSIAEKNAIEVSEEEIKQVATQDAIRHGMDIKEVLSKLEKDDKMKNYIYFTIKEAKVFEFVFSQIKKNVKKLDKKAFEKMLEEESKKAMTERK